MKITKKANQNLDHMKKLNKTNIEEIELINLSSPNFIVHSENQNYTNDVKINKDPTVNFKSILKKNPLSMIQNIAKNDPTKMKPKSPKTVRLFLLCFFFLPVSN